MSAPLETLTETTDPTVANAQLGVTPTIVEHGLDTTLPPLTPPGLVKLPHIGLEGLSVTNFPDQASFFRQFAQLAHARKGRRQPGVSLTYNVFSANLAQANPAFKVLLQQADILRCDGVGALLGSRLVGRPIATRLTNADYFPALLTYLAEQHLTVFLLGGKPGVAEKALAKLETLAPGHSVVGVHHGYLKGRDTLEQQLITQLNILKPDVIVVGMGMPVQEQWIAAHKDYIDTGLFFAVGALIDYFGDAQFRCPKMFQQLGLEWLTRLIRYPKRMFGRYVVGNPYYLYRMMALSLSEKRSRYLALKPTLK